MHNNHTTFIARNQDTIAFMVMVAIILLALAFPKGVIVW